MDRRGYGCGLGAYIGIDGYVCLFGPEAGGGWERGGALDGMVWAM